MLARKMGTLMFVLQAHNVKSATVVRGQYQGFAKAIMPANKDLEEKKLVGQRKAPAPD